MSEPRDPPGPFDDQGFLTDPELWSPELARDLAERLGVTGLDAHHWAVIGYLRAHYLGSGTLPWEGHLCRALGLGERCIHRLFGGPVEAWKIAGLPDPGEEARTYMLNLEP